MYIACNDQMCVSIREVNKEYEIIEEPIGLIQLTKTVSATIFAALKDVLIHCMVYNNYDARLAFRSVTPSTFRKHSVCLHRTVYNSASALRLFPSVFVNSTSLFRS